MCMWHKYPINNKVFPNLLNGDSVPNPPEVYPLGDIRYLRKTLFFSCLYRWKLYRQIRCLFVIPKFLIFYAIISQAHLHSLKIIPGRNGSVTVTDLEPGTYIVEEIACPDGYVMDTAPQTVYISDNEQAVVEVHFANSPKGCIGRYSLLISVPSMMAVSLLRVNYCLNFLSHSRSLFQKFIT